MLRLAVLGNMNNNGFALMRYMRDLGVDAHLLLYKNDGVGSLVHFKPENDTGKWDEWKPYVHQTKIVNSPFSALGGALCWAACMAQLCVWKVLGIRSTQNPWITSSALKRELKDFDLYIGSGIAPALFLRAGKILNGFYPYTTGVEFLGALIFNSQISKIGRLKKYLLLRAKSRQLEGLRLVECIFNGEMGLTKQVLDGAGLKFYPFSLPIMYKENLPEGSSLIAISDNVKNVLDRLGGRSFILSVSRQQWVPLPGMDERSWRQVSKNSDWLFLAFARIIQEGKRKDAVLAVLDYGPDSDNSKALCDRLEISEYVIWVPKLKRKELLFLASKALAISGEFKIDTDMIWGGVGWEALASSKPLLHSFNFGPGRFEKLFSIPRPPVVAANTEESVYAGLCWLVNNPQEAKEIGCQAGSWFECYNGIGLAQKSLDTLLLNAAVIHEVSRSEVVR